MEEEIVQQIVDDLLTSLEPLDTQASALLQFLKAKGLASDEELAPFLEQAGNASNVRWRATRVRIRSLISSAMKSAEPEAKNTPNKPEPGPAPAPETNKETAQGTSGRKVEPDQQTDDNSKPEKLSPAVSEKDENKKSSKSSKSEQAPADLPKEPTKDGPKENAA
jgi:hypothetical protein